MVETRELEDPRYVANAGDRCYFCKSALFTEMAAWCAHRGLGALAFGEITDDALDDRPGARAAREFGVLAPLAEAFLARDLPLPPPVEATRPPPATATTTSFNGARRAKRVGVGAGQWLVDG